jgi:RHS repeat-associated protein
VRDQQGNHIHYTLDGLGNRTQEDTYDPNGVLRRTMQRNYTITNRLDSVEGAGTPAQVIDYMEYDGNGNLLNMQDAETNPSGFTYDALNRVRTSTDAKNGVTSYSYDVNNQIASVTDPKGNTTTYTYDGLENIKTINSPDAGLIQFTEHDGAGNVLTRIDARNMATTYAYDALNRLDLITYDDATTADYVYDTDINGIGRIASIIDTSGSLSYSYDLWGRVTERVQVTDGVSLTMGYNYDAQGRLVSMIYPSGQQINYTYVNSVVSSISLAGGDTIMSNMQYEPFGPLSSWTWGNGASVSKVYDLDGQVISYTLGGGTRNLAYTPAGNVQTITDPDNGANNQTFGYDGMHQLSNYQGFGETYQYGYDAGGNRESLVVNGQSFAYNVAVNSNRLINAGGPIAKNYSYDMAGNVVADGVHNYVYDARGRLTSVDNGSVTYSINTLGQRVKKAVTSSSPGDTNGDGQVNQADILAVVDHILNIGNAPRPDCNEDSQVTVQDLVCVNNVIQNGNPETYETTFYMYDKNAQLRGEYDGQGAAKKEYLWINNTPIAVFSGGQIQYVYSDHLNTPRAIADTSNQVVWQWDSDPFGVSMPNEDSDGDGVIYTFNLRFAGQYYDAETNLHYNYHRTYDPSIGRYISSDPIGINGGSNLFTYAKNNPLRYLDMLGLRGLTQGEIALAQQMFGDSIDYNSVEIEQGWILGLPWGNTPAMAPNGNIYFQSTYYSPDFSTESLDRQGLFIHEMTHVWQYQGGESVMWRGIFERSYYYNVTCGDDLIDYDLEQQGQIVMDYFFRKQNHTTTSFGSQSYQQVPLQYYESVLQNFLVFPEYLSATNE